MSTEGRFVIDGRAGVCEEGHGAPDVAGCGAKNVRRSVEFKSSGDEDEECNGENSVVFYGAYLICLHGALKRSRLARQDPCSASRHSPRHLPRRSPAPPCSSARSQQRARACPKRINPNQASSPPRPLYVLLPAPQRVSKLTPFTLLGSCLCGARRRGRRGAVHAPP